MSRVRSPLFHLPRGIADRSFSSCFLLLLPEAWQILRPCYHLILALGCVVCDLLTRQIRASTDNNNCRLCCRLERVEFYDSAINGPFSTLVCSTTTNHCTMGVNSVPCVVDSWFRCANKLRLMKLCSWYTAFIFFNSAVATGKTANSSASQVFFCYRKQ